MFSQLVIHNMVLLSLQVFSCFVNKDCKALVINLIVSNILTRVEEFHLAVVWLLPLYRCALSNRPLYPF